MEKDLPIEKIIKLRKEKLNFLREEGVNPYPARFEATHNIPGIIKQFSALNSGETSEKVIKTCGRLILRREMGKAIFANIRDSSGTLQIYLRMNSVGEKSFETFLKNIDIGDFVGIEGVPFRTKTGELTVAVNSWTFLSKALRPLPEKWHGVKDIETIYRQRYLDLITNEESRNIFILRSNIISFIRNFLDGKGFLEVETPVMQTLPGGALARPFKTTHKTYDLELYLRIAPELSLKKIIVGGMDKIYEIGKSFRNEG
ncbi:MAG: amino acid--tRNA ligase-related protein, partial [Elusimicrobiota bacterium]